MSDTPRHIRHGLGAVRPYLYGQLELPEFVKTVFQARELERHVYGNDKGGAHVELQLGDSVVVIEASTPPQPRATPGQLCVYVEDVDAVYARALKAGARSLAPPGDKPYQERSAGIVDTSGNTWWLSTYLGPRG